MTGAVALTVSVATFFLWPVPGASLSDLDTNRFAAWLGMGLVGGAGLGAIGALARRAHGSPWLRAAPVAVYLALVAVDGWMRYRDYQEPLTLWVVPALVAVILLAAWQWNNLHRIAALTVAAVPLGLGTLLVTNFLGLSR